MLKEISISFSPNEYDFDLFWFSVKWYDRFIQNIKICLLLCKRQLDNFLFTIQIQRIRKHVLIAIKEYYASKQQKFHPNRFIWEMVQKITKRDLFHIIWCCMHMWVISYILDSTFLPKIFSTSPLIDFGCIPYKTSAL